MTDPVLQLEDLTVRFHLKRGQLTAIDGVTFTVHRGETFGLVGESGSGKTATARSVMRLIPIPPGEVVRGRILFEGTNILEYASTDAGAAWQKDCHGLPGTDECA
jgi:ABC-type dipeptide/oligopeptide/nickel transport system ATPase component